MFEITARRPQDAASIEDLLDAAFGPGRRKKTSYRYRDSVPPVPGLCFVACEGGRVVGSIAYWPVVVGSATPALLLGPLAVDPARQQAGIGGALMGHTLPIAAAKGHRLVFLVGDPAYYRRFGFTPVGPEIVMPGEKPERVQFRELAPDASAEAVGVIRPLAARTRIGDAAASLVSSR